MLISQAIANIKGEGLKAQMASLITSLVLLIIGGIAEIKGAFVASLLVGFVTTFGAVFLPQYYSLLPSILMVLVLLIKPEGLCGKRERL